MTETLAELLKHARTQQHLSQTDLGERLGKSRALVAQWESNLLEPSNEDTEKLAELLGIPSQTLSYQIEVARFKRRFETLVKEFPQLNASTIKQIIDQLSFEEIWDYQTLKEQLQSSNESERVHASQQLWKVESFLQSLMKDPPERIVQRDTGRVRGAIRVSNTAVTAAPSIPIHGLGIAPKIKTGPAIERPTPKAELRFKLRLHALGEDFSSYENCKLQVALEKDKQRLELAIVSPEVTSHEFIVNISVPLKRIEVPSGFLPPEVIDLRVLAAA